MPISVLLLKERSFRRVELDQWPKLMIVSAELEISFKTLEKRQGELFIDK